MVNPALLTWVDWLMLAIVLSSTLVSLWRGFVAEAMSLVGWVAAFVAAILLSQGMAQWLAPYIENAEARQLAAYVMVFIGVLLAANICSYLLKQLVRMTGLSALDRILGTVFGFARGVLVLLVLVLLARELIAPDNLQWMERSQLMPHLELLVQWVESVFDGLEFGWIPGLTI